MAKAKTLTVKDSNGKELEVTEKAYDKVYKSLGFKEVQKKRTSTKKDTE